MSSVRSSLTVNQAQELVIEAHDSDLATEPVGDSASLFETSYNALLQLGENNFWLGNFVLSGIKSSIPLNTLQATFKERIEKSPAFSYYEEEEVFSLIRILTPFKNEILKRLARFQRTHVGNMGTAVAPEVKPQFNADGQALYTLSYEEAAWQAEIALRKVSLQTKPTAVRLETPLQKSTIPPLKKALPPQKKQKTKIVKSTKKLEPNLPKERIKKEKRVSEPKPLVIKENQKLERDLELHQFRNKPHPILFRTFCFQSGYNPNEVALILNTRFGTQELLSRLQSFDPKKIPYIHHHAKIQIQSYLNLGYQSLGEVLFYARKTREDLPQPKDIAKELNLSLSQYEKFECNKQKPSETNLRKLATILNIDINLLIRTADKTFPSNGITEDKAYIFPKSISEINKENFPDIDLSKLAFFESDFLILKHEADLIKIFISEEVPSLAQWLFVQRKKQEKFSNEIAEAIEISSTSYSFIEKKVTFPTFRTLNKIKQYYQGVTLHFLLKLYLQSKYSKLFGDEKFNKLEPFRQRIKEKPIFIDEDENDFINRLLYYSSTPNSFGEDFYFIKHSLHLFNKSISKATSLDDDKLWLIEMNLYYPTDAEWNHLVEYFSQFKLDISFLKNKLKSNEESANVSDREVFYLDEGKLKINWNKFKKPPSSASFKKLCAITNSDPSKSAFALNSYLNFQAKLETLTSYTSHKIPYISTRDEQKLDSYISRGRQTLGEVLFYARKTQENMPSMQEIAHEIGMSSDAVEKLERNEFRPIRETLGKLAKALKLNLLYLENITEATFSSQNVSSKIPFINILIKNYHVPLKSEDLECLEKYISNIQEMIQKRIVEIDSFFRNNKILSQYKAGALLELAVHIIKIKDTFQGEFGSILKCYRLAQGVSYADKEEKGFTSFDTIHAETNNRQMREEIARAMCEKYGMDFDLFASLYNAYHYKDLDISKLVHYEKPFFIAQPDVPQIKFYFENNTPNLGQWLFIQRKAKGITCEKMGTLVGMNRSDYKSIEMGKKSDLKAPVLAKISKGLGRQIPFGLRV